MIKRLIYIDGYWKVIVYYNVNYNLFHIIEKDLYKINCTDYQIDSIYNNMINKRAKAVTISSIDYKTSVVLFNNHTSYIDYINSVIHEAEHIKQSILDVYNVEDFGEAPAYTIGYIASQMLMFLL
jgi:hypothetical protein